eukprot:CAMPEP_0118697846 /NCGR_PEP_ID=MMETSP0800-20121206/14799_1 /TAXON_ID=210618 ORGANISM="Striatella unipunctata, Strain CCMP2910" /NCGR_SAMPLE_ID=MMETSP0800 /ASSEMBLY_ACC=CAM_ASM_000638 /LENGTH=228 /DNA_ID=CAMNT_0006597455 /DNA_START=182 /DNA_END=868 /DNA_ORIENTATION=+
MESAINMFGNVTVDANGKISSSADGLTKYVNVTELDTCVLEENGVEVLAAATGKGYFERLQKDRNDTRYVPSPEVAIKAALTDLDLTGKLVPSLHGIWISFLGGMDMIVGECMDASELVTSAFGIEKDEFPNFENVTFHSLAYKEFPMKQATVVISLITKPPSKDLEGVARAVTEGKVFMDANGTYYTIPDETIQWGQEMDINFNIIDAITDPDILGIGDENKLTYRW